LSCGVAKIAAAESVSPNERYINPPNRFNGLFRKTVNTVNQLLPISITALKCGANEIFKLTYYQIEVEFTLDYH
jgi:hypothetical protein